MSPAATHNTFAKRKYPGVPLQMYCGLHFQKNCKKVPNEVQFGELYFSFFLHLHFCIEHLFYTWNKTLAAFVRVNFPLTIKAVLDAHAWWKPQ
jgi:hypothetical protein